MSGRVHAASLQRGLLLIEIIGRPSATHVCDGLDTYGALIPHGQPFATVFDASQMDRPDEAVRRVFAEWFDRHAERMREQVCRAFVTRSVMQRMIAQGVIMSLRDRGRIEQAYFDDRDDARAFCLKQLNTSG